LRIRLLVPRSAATWLAKSWFLSASTSTVWSPSAPRLISWVSRSLPYHFHYHPNSQLTSLPPPGTDLLAIARTDSEAATLITSTIDPRDHAYILGATNAALQPLNDLMLHAEAAGKTGPELQAVEDAWNEQASLKLFNEAVADTINAGVHIDKPAMIAEFNKLAAGKSNMEARAIAKGLTGVDVHFDWDAPRTREGYYRLRGGCQAAVTRAIAYAPYADLIWMESKLPDFNQAKEFAEGVHAVWPEQK
jgi:isocitrate lyase